MLFRVSMLAAAMFSGAATAAAPALDQVLTKNEGMTLVRDGLYAQTGDQGESYVAVNQAGRTALLEIVKQNRDLFEKGFSADGVSRTEQVALNDFDRTIAELSKPAAKASDERTGQCGDTQVYARTTSNGGTAATAYSVASNPNGPVAATKNFASTVTGITYQSVDTVGAAPASLSTSNPRVCGATGFATVTCPGDEDAKIWAFSVSTRVGGLGCWFQ